MTDKESPIQHSRETFSNVIKQEPIRVLSGTFSEADKPIAPQNNLQPIYPPNYGTKYPETNPVSSLPTYSPEIYIKDQPPLIFKVIPHRQNSIESLPTNIYKSEEEATKENTQTNSKQPIQTFNGTFSISSETFKTHTYDTRNPIYKPDTNIQSEIKINNNVQEIPLKKVFPITNVIAEVPNKDSPPEDEYSKKQNQNKKTIQSNPPKTLAATEEQIYDAKNYENSKPKISSTYMQEESKSLKSPSDHFFASHNWNQLFKDDFRFPLSLITPPGILDTIALLSGVTSADSKWYILVRACACAIGVFQTRWYHYNH
jgi:hypothetical protein